MLLTQLFAFTLSAQGESDESSTNPIVELHLDIRGRSCVGGSGLCSINKSNSFSNSNASIQINPSNETAFFIFFEDKMSEEEKNRLFNDCLDHDKECLILNHDYFINSNILSSGINTNFTSGYILKGQYPVSTSDNKLITSVKIKLYE